MAEYVIKVLGDENAPTAELHDAAGDLRDLVGSALSGELRGSDSAELDAMADLLAELRTALNAPEIVTHHVCQHDVGIGDCAAAMEVR